MIGKPNTNKAQQLNLQTDDKIHLAANDEYEYVFDESQYVNFDGNEETIISGDEEQVQALSSKSKDIESLKMSLPVYQYKKEFLKLLEGNQVIIIVGRQGQVRPRSCLSIFTKVDILKGILR